MEIDYERLDFAGTLGKLAELTGRELLLELRVGSLDGPFRLAARGVLTGQQKLERKERKAHGAQEVAASRNSFCYSHQPIHGKHLHRMGSSGFRS